MAGKSNHVAQHVHHARTKARAGVAHGSARAPKTPHTFQRGELVIDTQTGQEGVVLRGKVQHVPAHASHK